MSVVRWLHSSHHESGNTPVSLSPSLHLPVQIHQLSDHWQQVYPSVEGLHLYEPSEKCQSGSQTSFRLSVTAIAMNNNLIQ